MKPTAAEAAEFLAHADKTRRSVQSQGGRESRAFIGWGLFILLFFPLFDFVNSELWAPIILGAAAVGTLVTALYFYRARSRIRLISPVKWWVWMVWTAWYCAMLATAAALQGHFPFASTVAAIGTALPLLAYGTRLARRGQ